MKPRNWISIIAWCAVGFSTSSTQAAERNPRIQQAIDRGVAFVRSQQNQDGIWLFGAMNSVGGGNVGATALVGLTLLECGASADDAVVQQAAKFIRQNAASLDFTYALSTSIWFLDRLGDEADVPLIQLFAVRLMGGQNEFGGWTYTCPVIGGVEERRLMNRIQPRPAPLPRGGEGKGEGAAKKDPAAKPDPDKDKKRELPPEIKEMLKLLERRPAQPGQPAAGGDGIYQHDVKVAGLKGDNSNTQFASLALWVAHRYGMPVEPALIGIEKRFRATQMQDGGWTYIPSPNGLYSRDVSPAMTCAGLIGLAVGHGAAVEVAKEKRGAKVLNPDKDMNMQAGFMHLGAILQEYAQVGVMSDANDRGFYFLWSLERVGEIYGLPTIGRRDWYAWGSTVLLNSQWQDGSWKGKFRQSGVDTCFALLFLVRANVAKDLSVTLRGKVKDPGTRTLKAGGVGGDGLAPKRDKGDKVAESSDRKSQKEPGVPKLPDPKEKLGAPPSASKTTPESTENEEIQAARKMSEDLVAAAAAQQDELLGKYKEGKGASNTLALAGAIPQLSGESKSKARDALAERFTRMTAETLRAELKDDDPEIRRAASLACAMKDDKSHVPDLIPLLDDSEPLVARAAHAALKSLTNQDFGPAREASTKDRGQAIEAWKSWWTKQEKK